MPPPLPLLRRVPLPLLWVVLVPALAGRLAAGSARAAEPAAPPAPDRAATLRAMESIMGPLPGPERRGPLELRVESETDAGEFIRQEISYQREPGSRVPAYLLIPRAARRPGVGRVHPAVLALHQTHPQGRRVVVGLGNSPDDEYGVELARRGYVVLAPPYTLLADYQPDIAALGYASGTLFAVWTNIRGLDLLESLPYVRTNGFGAIGHSLGGHNGLFTAAFDPRLRVVVTSCGFDSFRDYYDGDPANWQLERGWCQTRYMPRLAAYRGRLGELPFDFPDLLRAIAPRMVWISAPVGDSNFRWRSVDRCVEEARPAYAAAGAAGNLRVLHPPTAHQFDPVTRSLAYAALDEVLGAPPAGGPRGGQ